MKEKLKSRFTPELDSAETQEERPIDDIIPEGTSKPIEDIELPVCDVSLERSTPSVINFDSLNTNVAAITPDNNIVKIGEIADILLSITEIKQFSPILGTNVSRSEQIVDTSVIKNVAHSDLILGSRTLAKQNSELNTTLVIRNLEESVLENVATSNEEIQLPFFEWFINCDGRFPRSFSESSNSPFIVLVGADVLEGEEHLFSWDDSKGFLSCLLDDYNIGWAKNVKIREPDGKTKFIHATDGKELAKVTIDEGIEKATLSISDSTTHNLVVKEEDGKIDLYRKYKREWHIPIIYALKELFREITDRYPKITFRDPEVWGEGMEELVDSLDPHSLDRFGFEYKIEFLDARKMYLAVDEFAKTVKGRLNSGFLQQFGVLVIAVKQNDLENATKAIKTEGLRIYTCKPDNDNANYKRFCSKSIGLTSLKGFFEGLKRYEKELEVTNQRFSILVKRGDGASDKLQYPLKVATFVYLLNDLINRKKKTINNFKELYEFLKENNILEQEIQVEHGISINKDARIIPDIIYSPECEDKDKKYIEIETLVGTFEPMKKVDETIEKYKEVSDDTTIWIVLNPISAMLHYEELKSRKKAYEHLYDGKKIEFKVLSLITSGKRFKWDLVDLDKFREVKENVK